MYKLEHITQFEAQHLMDCLSAQNQGKGSIQDLRKIIKLLDKVENLAGGPPNKAVTNLMLVVDALPEEKRTKVTIQEAEALQESIWDSVYIESLNLENDEFSTLKAALEQVSEGNQLPKDRRSLRRFDGLFARFEQAVPFDANADNAQKSQKKK